MADNYCIMKKFFSCLLFCFFLLPQIFNPARGLYAQDSRIQDLILNADDLVVEQKFDNGFHLYIRKKPGMGSVLITETTRDPLLQSDNYAYRTAEWNAVNGNEIRLINGSPILPESRIYSLISSTVVTHPVLGEAFHIFIPQIIEYGYEDTRHGEIYVANGTYLNLRTFSLPYGDYRGAFTDNPFILQIIQKPLNLPAGFYMKETVESFGEIAKDGGGLLVYSSGPDDLAEKIRSVLENEKGKSVDIVLCLDTTESMVDDIDGIRKTLVPMLREIAGSFADYRLGLVLYKDYYDEYLNRVIPFTRDFAVFQRNIDAIRVRGGGDIPEAVYEALYEGAVQFPWEAESRLMILIGDAPPHPRPRGRITKEIMVKAAEEKNIKVSAIILPQ